MNPVLSRQLKNNQTSAELLLNHIDEDEPVVNGGRGHGNNAYRRSSAQSVAPLKNSNPYNNGEGRINKS